MTYSGSSLITISHYSHSTVTHHTSHLLNTQKYFIKYTTTSDRENPGKDWQMIQYLQINRNELIITFISLLRLALCCMVEYNLAWVADQCPAIVNRNDKYLYKRERERERFFKWQNVKCGYLFSLCLDLFMLDLFYKMKSANPGP